MREQHHQNLNFDYDSFSSATYLIMKKLKNVSAARTAGSANVFNRYVFLIIGSLEQYNDEFNMEENRDVSENEGGIVVYDVMLDFNHKAFDPFHKKAS